jgi:tRNA(fMet)-specific endonuclease VapC
MFLFDTDTISNLLKPMPSVHLIGKLQPLAANEQFISTITVYEMVYGAWKSSRRDYHLQRLQTVLLPNVQIAVFNNQAAFECGRLRAQLELAGIPLSLADLQIAAIAMVNNFTLITGNTKHFSRIPLLKVENWM